MGGGPYNGMRAPVARHFALSRKAPSLSRKASRFGYRAAGDTRMPGGVRHSEQPALPCRLAAARCRKADCPSEARGPRSSLYKSTVKLAAILTRQDLLSSWRMVEPLL